MPLFGCVVLGLAGENPLARARGVRPLVFEGEASYCLYLLHFNSWNLIHKYNLPAHLGVARFDPWFSYALLIVIALVAYYTVEIPGRRWILDRWSHRKH